MKKWGLGTFAYALLASTSVCAASSYVGNIKVEGVERVEPETVKSYVDIKAGQNVSDDQMNIALKQLYATGLFEDCLLYTSPSPRDRQKSRMPSSA